ncbi:MAG TPA: ferritin family protein [Thermoanaerobaculia bacterium]|nr:ferritin family protein [Thermoanaerobaculia bacterium]
MKPLVTTVRDVLGEAIESELASREYYTRLADRASDAQARARLLDLAHRQIAHRATLEQRYRELVGEEPPVPTEPTVELPDDLQNIDAVRGLRIALELERESESNYRFLAERATDPDLLKLFSELAEMEWKHKAEIQREYDALGADPEALLFE